MEDNRRVELICAILLLAIALFGDALVNWAIPESEPPTADERICQNWGVCRE